ncbi:hypothetical protein [Streptomyces sp. NPDC058667]|uniref:hypothetical protein n=1 Tax=Streptomyces sp. NPDC058667 TaxID=3346588 RepID=UPI00365D31FB
MAYKRIFSAALSALFVLVACAPQGDDKNPPPSPKASSPKGTSDEKKSPSSSSSQNEELFTTSATIDDAESFHSNSKFFVTVGDENVITYTASGTEVARSGVKEFEGGCILAVVGSSPESGSLIWGRVTEKPAAGLTPQTWTLSIVATDAKTHEQRWSKPLIADSKTSLGCQDPKETTVTRDEKWLAFGQWVIDLTDGTSRALGDGIVPRAVGNYILVFDGVCANCLNGMKSVPVTDPATGRTLFSFPEHDIIGSLSDAPGKFATYSDGSTLFIARRMSGDPLSYALQSRSLATGKVNWEVKGVSYSGPISQKVTLVEDAGVVIFPDLAAADAKGVAPDGLQKELGLSLSDGKRLWAIPGLEVCAANSAGVAVETNNQLVVIDPRTGRQLAYTPERSDCGQPLGEYSYYSDDDALVRVLPATG